MGRNLELLVKVGRKTQQSIWRTDFVLYRHCPPKTSLCYLWAVKKKKVKSELTNKMKRNEMKCLSS